MRHNLASPQQRGLSLIELLVTLSIAVILLTIGVPSFVSFITSNTATSYVNDMLADLNYARTEAITRSLRVTVCHSTDSSTCSTTGSWADGWIVFANINESGATGQDTRDGDDLVLRVHRALSSGWTLTGAADVVNYLAFQPTGLSATAHNSGVGTFTLCKGAQVQTGNVISLNQTGRVAVTNGTCL